MIGLVPALSECEGQVPGNWLAAACVWTDAAGFAFLAYSEKIGWVEDADGTEDTVVVLGIQIPRLDQVRACNDWLVGWLVGWLL